jgi:hypothetical protein
MSFTRTLRGRRRLVLLLACLIAFTPASVAGCSQGVGAGSLSGEDQAKAKAAFKKRFENFGERKTNRKSR